MLHTFNVVSVNLARQLGEVVSLDAFTAELELCMQNWSVVFIAECDFHRNADFSPDPDFLQRTRHRYYRHWPGQGVVPYCVLVNRLWAPYLRHIEFKNRACRIDFRQSHRSSWSTVFLHWTPGDDGYSDAFHTDMFDTACLVTGRPKRSSLLMAGDFYVDFLPSIETDLYGYLPKRA